MKNITLCADERLIDAARERARAENSTLDEQFRLWLADYAQVDKRLRRYDEVMGHLRGKLLAGGKITRNQMNDR